MNKISDNIKRLRLEKGYTQQEVADKLFVTRQCISRWETGKSIPDIESLEQLTIILETTINDIIDKESIKYMTIEDSRKIHKWQKYQLRYIVLTLFLFAVLILGIFWIGSKAFRTPEEKDIIEVIAKTTMVDQDIITFENDNGKTNTFDINLFQGEIYDYYEQEIEFESLEVGYLVKISYDSEFEIEHFKTIQVLDYQVEESIFGIVFNTTGTDYDTFEDMPIYTNPSGLRYAKIDGNHNEWQHNLQISNFTITTEKISDYRDKVVLDITVYMDYRHISNEAKIGLITTNGIEYVETIDPYYNTTRSYSGKIQIDESDQIQINSMDIEIRISIKNVKTMSSFEVYEYDINHTLIETTYYQEHNDFIMHHHNENAIYSIIKLNYYEDETYEYAETFQLMLGEDFQFFHADEYGLVWERDFRSK